MYMSGRGVSKKKLKCLYPLHFCGRGVSHACLSVVSAMASSDLDIEIMGVSSDKDITSPVYIDCIPREINFIAYRVFKEDKLRRICENRFLKRITSNDIVYLWPGTTLELFEKVKDRGCKIVVENINCHQFISKQILDLEFDRLGIKPTHSITDVSIRDEVGKLELSNYVFSPSPTVTESLLASGVVQEKILQTSYGLNEMEILRYRKNDNESKPFTAIFVGRIGVRKGIHLLLDYWCKAKIDGVLKIVGQVEDSARALIEPYLNHPGIQFIKYTNNLEEVYRNADLFVLPSLEEGSPLVTYLAIGAGLPCLVSPMGGGGIVKDGEEGYVIDPHDEDGWISSILKLKDQPALREYFSKTARNSAQNYLWKKVGNERAVMLLDRMGC